MFKYQNKDINKISLTTNFNRNTTEKVLRLYDILKYIGSSEFSGELVLKGGTAINLFLLNLPRLSVDIDLDFNLNANLDEMLKRREKIDMLIRRYMKDEGYYLSDKSKFTHSLDSYSYSYDTTSGAKDNLKIEINYSNRIHVLNIVNNISSNLLGETVTFNHLSIDELIGSKLSALLSRTTPRDVYDVFNIFNIYTHLDIKLIKKIALFYLCLGETLPFDFDELLKSAENKIKSLSFQTIKETLIPVLHKGIKFNVEEMCRFVSNKLKELFILDNNDIEFINQFNNKIYNPNILFDGYKINDIMEHPMALWKIKK